MERKRQVKGKKEGYQLRFEIDEFEVVVARPKRPARARQVIEVIREVSQQSRLWEEADDMGVGDKVELTNSLNDAWARFKVLVGNDVELLRRPEGSEGAA